MTRHPPTHAIVSPAVAVAWPALLVVSIALALFSGLAALYLVKSALGIDLLPGPSPLHNLLYPLLGRS